VASVALTLAIPAAASFAWMGEAAAAEVTGKVFDQGVILYPMRRSGLIRCRENGT
jgi:hypothetical protein